MKKLLLTLSFLISCCAIFAQADISITNTDNSTIYTAGQTKTYIVTVKNNGPDTATGVIVQNIVQTGIPQSNVTWIGSNGASGTGDLNNAIGSMTLNQTITYTITVNVPSNFSQTTNLVNTVTYTATTVDPTPSCSQCVDTDTPSPLADLQILKTDNQSQFYLNAPNTYTITIKNNGPSDALNVKVIDNMPVGITSMSWSGNGSSGTGNMSNTVATLTAGQTVTYTVTIQVPANYNPVDPFNPTQTLTDLTNKITVTSNTPDPTPSCPGCTDVDTPRPKFVTVSTTQYTVPSLVKDVLINSPCVAISNISWQKSCGIGYFNRNNSTFPIKDGLIIRTGSATASQGKFDDSTITANCTDTPASPDSDADLASILGTPASSLHDAAFVKFEFTPTISDFSFNFVFAANEYGTFQCGQFQDVFAFILTNLSTGVSTNLAVVPNTTTPVSVFNIKNTIYNTACPSLNPTYFGKFNENTATEPNNRVNSSINVKGETIKMKASSTVVPNTPYSIKLVIADKSDNLFDSSVFIEAGSFTIGKPHITGTGALVSVDTGITSCEGVSQTIQAATSNNPNLTYSWTKDGVLIPGANGYQLIINQPGEYCCTFTYASGCNETSCMTVNPQLDLGLNEPKDLVKCVSGTFNLNDNIPIVLGTKPPSDYNITFYKDYNNALVDFDAIAEPELSNYNISNGDTIYMKIEYLVDNSCIPIKTFKVKFSQPGNGSFTYNNTNNPITDLCNNSAIATPTLSAITPSIVFPTGGVFSTTAATSTGFTVDSVTGVISFGSAIAGSYIINYNIPAGVCPAFAASTTVNISNCLAVTLNPITPVCASSTVILTSSNAGPGVTYHWMQNATVLGTTLTPTFTMTNVGAGVYNISVYVTKDSETSAPSSQTLTVNPVPVLAALPNDYTICSNSNTIIQLTGTPNAIVTYFDGSVVSQVTLSSSGTGAIVTPVLTSCITYTITNIKLNITPDCAVPLSDSITVCVGAPTASMATTVDTVCSGTPSTSVTITGTPNATVTYQVNGGANQTITIPASGSISIPTGNLTVTTTYTLISVISSGANPCSATLMGQQTVVNINPLPTAAISTTTPTICSSTSGNLVFTGTSGDVVTFSNGTTTSSITLTGATTNLTQVLTASTTYTLISITRPTTNCVNTLTGSVTININPQTTLVTSPQSDTKCIGDVLTLSAVATGNNLTYQWQKNNVNIATATSATLTINAVIATDAGDYTCIITGQCGTITTATATIIVRPAIAIITNATAVSSTVCVGQPINISLSATGSALNYQWQLNGVNIASNTTAITNNLVINAATVANSATYTCLITDSCNKVVTSVGVLIKVNELPSITAQTVTPSNGTVCEGQSFTLNVTAPFVDGQTFQWFNGTTAITGATSATLTVAAANLTTSPGNYTCRVSGSCAPAVTSTPVAISVIQAPKFTTQPAPSTTLCEQQNLTLSVVATGTGLTYQWLKDNVNLTIASATSSTLTINNVTVADSGTYSCVIYSTGGVCTVATSNGAIVGINQLPSITAQTVTPSNGTVCEGQSFTLNVTAPFVDGQTFQWFNGTTAITGATSATLTVAVADLTTSPGNYTCRVSGSCAPAVTSTPVAISVIQAPKFTTQPATSTTLCEQQNLTLSVVATGTGLTYQWLKDNVNLTNASATSSTLTINNVTLADSGVYSCVIYSTGGVCTVATSNGATVNINKLPSITAQTVTPSNGTVCEGQSFTLNVTAPFVDGQTFQWFNGTTAITGATSATLTVATADLTTSPGNYTCRVSGSCAPAVTSTPVAISVIQAPKFTTQPATSTTLCEQQNLTLSVVATGTGLTYQWLKDNVNLTNASATSSTLTINNVTVADSGVYSCVIYSTGGVCTVATSNGATVNINKLPNITAQTVTPSNGTVCEGQSFTLNVTAPFVDGQTFQWFNGTTAITGATSATLTVAAADLTTSPGNYTCRVSGSCAPAVTSTPVAISVIQAPKFTTQPATSTTLCEQQNLTLSVVATGTGLTYQWFKDNVNLTNASATSSTLTINNVTVADSGTYSCVIYSTGGVCTVATSNGATVNINKLPSITAKTVTPSNGTVCEGQSFTLNVTAPFVDGQTFQWFNGTTAITGATSATLTVAAADLTTSPGNYTCRVSGSCAPAVTSTPVVISVIQAPKFTTHPIPTTLCEQQNLTLSVVATGTGLTYQWFKDNVNLTNASATSSTLTINNVTVADSGTYSCVIYSTGGVCTVATSNGAIVNINKLPNITAQTVTPSNGTVCEGQSFTLAVTAPFVVGQTFQWFNGTTAITGATSATLTVAAANLTTSPGNYSCRVSGSCAPAVTSTPVAISVVQAPKIVTQPIAAVNICANENFTLSVVATGTNLTYQWKNNGINVSNATATSSTLIINPALTTDSGNYVCVVSNGSGTCSAITSTTTVVKVNGNVSLGTIANQSICEGEILTLTVPTTGGTSLTYQWQKGGVNIVGATGPVYTDTNTTTADSGNYTCIVKSGSCPAVTSNIIKVTISPTPYALLTYGSTAAVCMNDPASMRIDGTANATVTYTENNVTKTVILDSTGKAILPTGNLKADVTFTLISVSTSIAPICSTTIGGQSLTIKVNLKPVVELEDGYICLHPTTGVTGRTYTLKTNLDPTLYSFVWYKSNIVLTGETGASYVATSTGTYKVKVTNKTTGCSSTDTADVMSSTRPVSASVQITTDYFAENGTVVVTALATSSNYEYRLDYGPYQTSNVFENVQNGEHTIYVRDLQNCGEIATAPFIIIDYPKFFTPNGDGYNDTWIINPTKNINNNAIVNAKIYIFDRFGKLLKQISTIGEGWDGTFVGQPMPADDYWFTIQYTENTINKEFKAHFSLKR